MTIKLIKSPSYVAGQGLKLTGEGPGMKVPTAGPPPGPLTALGEFDVMLQSWDTATSTHNNSALGVWAIMPGDVGINVVDYAWTNNSSSPWWGDLSYVLNFNPGEGVSTALRATVDGGTTWTNATFDAARPSGSTGQWIIRLKDMTKPAGGPLSTVSTAGSTFTLTVQSSADGVTWSQIFQKSLTTYEYYT